MQLERWKMPAITSLALIVTPFDSPHRQATLWFIFSQQTLIFKIPISPLTSYNQISISDNRIMSFPRNFQGGRQNFHGDYWATCEGHSFSNINRKRSRPNHHYRNYNNYNDYQENFWVHGGNTNFMRGDHANYVRHDVMPSSHKRRKHSASTWEDSRQRYFLPPTFHENAPSYYSFPAPPARSNADTSTSAKCKQHDVSRLGDGESIFMSRDEIDRFSPSRKDGIDVLHETQLRYSYCAFLQDLGMRLELPQTTLGTTMVLCHRFFFRQSHACHDRFLIATAALFLAAKSEETPRPLNDVLRASSEILHRQDFALLSFLLPVDWFEQYRERVFEAEQLILTTLNFELNVQHPYGPLTSILDKLGLSQTVLVNLALNLVSEGLRSSLWLQFKPHHIAAGAAYLAAKFLKMDLSAYQNIWLEFKTTPSILHDVTRQLMELF